MIYAFNSYKLDTHRRTLTDDVDEQLPLRPKGFQLLLYLIEHRNRAVDKDELCEQLWPEQFISEATLTGTIRDVRRAVGDSAQVQQVIQTVHSHGYRFIAPLTIIKESEDIVPVDPVVQAPLSPPPVSPSPVTPPAVPPSPGLLPPVGLSPGPVPVAEERAAVTCIACAHPNRSSARFCEACGTSLALACPNCQHTIWLTAKFCDQCGHTLMTTYTPQHLSDKILIQRHEIEGERKQVTVLFASVANFSQISQRLDPEDVHGLMDGWFEHLTSAIHRYEGTINQFTGDGMMALFGAPIAHEDHVQRALLAGLASQEALQTYSRELKHCLGIDFQLQMGINTGLVVVGHIGDNLRMDYTAQGDTVNLAAQLQRLAEPGTILVTEATYRLVQGYFTWRSFGQPELRRHSPTQVFQVMAQQIGRARIDIFAEQGFTPYVGRQRELEQLTACVSQTHSHQGQIVSVIGHAGLGKSRLLHELREHLTAQDVTYLEGRCFSYGQSVLYLPFVAMLKRFFGVEENETIPNIEARIRHVVEQMGGESSVVVPHLTALLSGQLEDAALQELAPEVRRRQMFVAILSFFTALGERHPLVVIIEDLHWIDQSSEALLSFLAEHLGSLPLFLLITYRPEYTHNFGNLSYYTQITLHPFSPAESRSLLMALLGTSTLSSDVEALLTQKGEGNPLYLEEITKAVLERDLLQRTENGYVVSRAIDPGDMPETIQDLITARIDRLSSEHKHVLQTASVIGREVPSGLLRQVIEQPLSLEASLSELQRLEFFYAKLLLPEP